MSFIPRYDVKVRVEAKADQLGWPAQGAAPCGGCFNHEYVNLRGARWRDVEALLKVESTLIERCVRDARDTEEFDQLFKQAEIEFVRHATEFDDELDFVEGAFLDLGTAAATLALNAAGCPTISSCNGHDPGFPSIIFLGRPEMLDLLRQSARTAGVGLLTADEGFVEVFSDVPDGLVRFAAAMRERSAQFRRAR